MLHFKKIRTSLSGEKEESVIKAENLSDAREHVLAYFRASTRAITFEEFQDKIGTQSFRTKDKDGKIILELLWIPGR